MFRELRRKHQQLSETEARSILKSGTYGVLSVQGDDGYPYGVPLNYVYGDDAIYFHCAKEGHKVEGFQRSDKVSFCVVGEDEVIPEAFSTAYTSVIVFGRAAVVTDKKEKREALKLLAERFSPELEKEGEAAIQNSWNDVCVVRLNIEYAVGKAGRERIKREEARYASFL